jgi:transcription antitermination factor NusG
MRAFSTDNFVDAPWYLALCRPNQSHIAFRNLVGAGFDAFMPRHRASWRWRGKQVDGWRPVFGGYLFFSTDPANPRWHEMASMPGIGSLVKIGQNRPVPVPSAVVTGLMLRCDADGCLIPDADLRIGEAVRLTCGPFAGFVGTVEQIDADRRVHMLLDILGRGTTLTAPHFSVERVV